MLDYLELKKQLEDYYKKTTYGNDQFLDQIIPVIRRMESLQAESCTDRPILIAIDGNSTAGKSSFATMLQKLFRCNLFHMDDFFLRPEQRTRERAMEPGGNVDYERFYQEIIEPLLAGQTVLYHPLDCKTMSYKAQVTVQPHMLNIIEGAYCQHSYFGDIYDLRIFMVVGAEEQKLRVKARDPWLYGRYIKEWIPMENSYSSFFGIKEQSDYVIYT